MPRLGAKTAPVDASEERDQLFNSSEDLLIIRSPDAGYVRVNPAYVRLVGDPVADTDLTDPQNVIHPDDWPARDKAFGALSEGQPSAKWDARIKVRSGGYRWIEWSATSNISRTRLFIIGRDIHDSKLLQSRIEESENELNRAQEIAELGSWSLDVATGTFLLSDQFYRILGLERGDIEPSWESVRQFIHPEDLALVEEARSRVGDQPRDAEFRIIRRSGQVRNVLGRVRMLRDEQGRPLRTHGILMDITERKSLRAQLLQSQKMEAIGQLTGGIAHDFNNFLTVVLGCSELLAIEFAGDPRLGGLATMIQTAAKKGADLTHQMLAFGRRQTLQSRATNTNKLLEGMTTLLGRTLRGDIEIVVAPAEELWTAIVDPVQVESSILNLCLNARDAMPDGGRLTIETSNEWLDQDYAGQHSDVTPGPYVCITVTDTGFGIPPENIDKIFEPFFTTKEAGKGTGLGLSMVFGFVKQSRGHVKIYSEMGIGTSVRLYLPREESETVDEVRPQSSVLDLGGTEKILLVEDDPLVLRYAEDLLSSMGYQVISATNGPDALNLVQTHPDIDLLFTDMVMPGGMNGRQLAEEVAKLCPTLKVLFTSGYTENVVRQQGEFGGSIALLNKPYTRSQLGARIRSVLVEP